MSPFSIRDAHVAVVGAGALGCAVLPHLARLPIAALTVIDGDSVELGNIERQALYAEMDVGFPKASTAKGWLQLVGPAMAIRSVDRFFDTANAIEFLQGHHLVIDCTDDLHAKQAIDDTCADLGIPLVSGAVHEHQGQVIVLHAPGDGSGLRRADLFTGRVGPDQDGCDMRRVPMELIEAMGQRMYQQARAVLNGQPVVNGRIELFEFGRQRWTAIDPPRS